MSKTVYLVEALSGGDPTLAEYQAASIEQDRIAIWGTGTEWRAMGSAEVSDSPIEAWLRYLALETDRGDSLAQQKKEAEVNMAFAAIQIRNWAGAGATGQKEDS
mgnify:CR=1 FL=1